MSVTKAQLKELFPSANAVLVDAVVELWPEADAAGINNPRRVSQFFANFGVETGGLRLVEESLNYSVESLLAKFSRHRISEADARQFGRKKGERALGVTRQREIANRVYGGPWGKKNLGNTQPNDGWDFRGGGGMQTTGRANYTALGFADNPAALREPKTAFRTAIREFVKRGCPRLADAGETKELRRVINGGSNGLPEVRAYLAKALGIFKGYQSPKQAARKPVEPPAVVVDAVKPQPAPVPAAEVKTVPLTAEEKIVLMTVAQDLVTLYPSPAELRLSPIEKVYFAVQSKLAALKYNPGGLDGKPGEMTAEAVRTARAKIGMKDGTEIDAAFIEAVPSIPLREFSAERENATPAVVAEKKPAVAVVASTKWYLKPVAWVLALFGGGGTAVDAVNLVDASGQAKSITDNIREYLPSTSALVLALAFAVVLYFVIRQLSKSQEHSTEDFRNGDLR